MGKEPQCFLRALNRASLVGVGGILVLLQLSLVPPSVSLLIPGSLHPQNSREGTLFQLFSLEGTLRLYKLCESISPRKAIHLNPGRAEMFREHSMLVKGYSLEPGELHFYF